ncbi:hypothetical protein Tco_1065857 [Tanacetum coccineum]
MSATLSRWLPNDLSLSYHQKQNQQSKLAIEALRTVTSAPEDEDCPICLMEYGGGEVKEMPYEAPVSMYQVNLDRTVEMAKHNTIEVVAIGPREVTGQEYKPDFGKLNHSGPGSFEHWAGRVPGPAESCSSLGSPRRGGLMI